MADRKPAAGAAAPSCGHERLDREVSALARALCRIAAKLPGREAEMDRILINEYRISRPDAESIIAAAERNWQ